MVALIAVVYILCVPFLTRNVKGVSIVCENLVAIHSPVFVNYFALDPSHVLCWENEKYRYGNIGYHDHLCCHLAQIVLVQFLG